MGKSRTINFLLSRVKSFWGWFRKKSPAFIVLTSLTAVSVIGLGVGGTLAATGAISVPFFFEQEDPTDQQAGPEAMGPGTDNSTGPTSFGPEQNRSTATGPEGTVSLVVAQDRVDVTESSAQIDIEWKLSTPKGVEVLIGVNCSLEGKDVFGVSINFMSKAKPVITSSLSSPRRQSWTFDSSNIKSNKDFTVNAYVILPAGSDPGTYICKTTWPYVATDSIEVIRTEAKFDVGAPVINLFDVSQSVVDVSSSSARVDIDISVSDPNGIDWVIISCSYGTDGQGRDIGRDPIVVQLQMMAGTMRVYVGSATKPATFFWPIELEPGPQTSLATKVFLDIPQGARPGVITCGGEGTDLLGNTGYYRNLDSLEIQRVGDNFEDNAPEVSLFSISEQTVDVSSADATVEVQFSATDATGIQQIDFSCDYRTRENVYVDYPRFGLSISFTAEDKPSLQGGFYDPATGIYTPWSALSLTGSRTDVSGTISGAIPAGSPPGSYLCGYYVVDVLGATSNSVWPYDALFSEEARKNIIAEIQVTRSF
jgi:hypothetical protein